MDTAELISIDIDNFIKENANSIIMLLAPLEIDFYQYRCSPNMCRFIIYKGIEKFYLRINNKLSVTSADFDSGFENKISMLLIRKFNTWKILK
jgi:hypothetical protein